MKSNYAALMWAVGKFDFFDAIYPFCMGELGVLFDECHRSLGVSVEDERVTVDGADIFKVEFEREKLHMTPDQLDQAEAQALGANSNVPEDREVVDIPNIDFSNRGVWTNSTKVELAPPPWDGEGLPPVGCECEHIHHLLCDWTKVKILSHEGGVITYMWTNPNDQENPMVMWDRHASNFRPIETAWQKEHKKDRELSLAWAYIINNSEHTIHSIGQMEDEYVIDLANRMREEDDRN